MNEDQISYIAKYSRAEAIEDGVLIDCTQPPFDELNRNAGLRVHVAMTAEAFASFVHPLGNVSTPLKIVQSGKDWKSESRSERDPQLPPGQDIKGRYWDIVWMLRLAMSGQQNATSVLFRFYSVPNGGGKARLSKLKCGVGPDDEGNPCLTIMLPEQD
jgi:hypothetical protein